jgi:hypothetical protein
MIPSVSQGVVTNQVNAVSAVDYEEKYTTVLIVKVHM